MADDYLTVDEVAAQLAVPLEMIQRRIESGDIPVHWVEIDGKLEMRISSAEIGVEQPETPPTPFPTPVDFEPELPQPAGGEVAAQGWSVRDGSYSEDLWTPAEGGATAPVPTPPSAAGTPWEVPAPEGIGFQAEPEPAPEPEPIEAAMPVWRPDPVTWEDEPLQSSTEAAAADDVAPYSPAGSDSFFPAEEDEEAAAYAVPPPSAAEIPSTPEPAEAPPEPQSYPEPVAPPVPAGVFSASNEAEDEEEPTPFSVDDENSGLEVDELLVVETTLPSQMLGVAEAVEVPRPSALAAAQSADSSLALNSIDARELVAGLFERWERALEQRIQAEQRLRFEAELERRLRQVRDLRQELENTRKSTAAQLAEREQEVLALRSRLRDQETSPKSRGIFRR